MVEVEVVWRTLYGIKVPGFDIDVLSSGLVEKVKISRDGFKIAVYVNFWESNPRCGFCRFINHTLMHVVVSRIKDALRGLGFAEVLVVDSTTGAEL